MSRFPPLSVSPSFPNCQGIILREQYLARNLDILRGNTDPLQARTCKLVGDLIDTLANLPMLSIQGPFYPGRINVGFILCEPESQRLSAEVLIVSIPKPEVPNSSRISGFPIFLAA